MDENPYKSPEIAFQAAVGDCTTLAPMWRRIVSLPLIIFGIGYLLDSPVALIALSFEGQYATAALISALMLIGGVILTWAGFGLRRRRSTDRPRRVTA